MWTTEARKKGNQNSAKISREKALQKYYSNPNHCLACKNIIHIKNDERCVCARKKKFCSHTCAAIYNNRNRKRKIYQHSLCQSCGVEVKNKSNYVRKFCSICLKKYTLHGKDICGMSKKDLFSKDYFIGRSTIQSHARRLYAKSEKPKHCIICGYSKHFQTSHIKSVSSFQDTALVSEINSLDNLVALCPLHHWEFDHGLLTLNEPDYSI